jgi:multidrug efflux pump subunit AcrA (membrane-fusion protein)
MLEEKKKKRKIKISYVVVASLILILIMFRLAALKNKRKTIKQTLRSIPVEVYKASNDGIRERIFLTGEIRGINEVKIFSFVTGVLRAKLVHEGQIVGVNQALFSIDQTQRGLDILDKIIRSPIYGVVTEITPDVGDQVVANQTVIARVVQSAQVKVVVSVGMIHLSEVKIGHKAIVKVSSYANKEFYGRVSKISPTVDVNNRTVEVEVVINNPQGELKSGMFSEVQIITSNEKPKILIPQESVLFDDNINYVYKIDESGKKVERQIVTIGNNYSGKLEIKEGLNAGELVLTKGQYNVFSGYPVKIIKTLNVLSDETPQTSPAAGNANIGSPAQIQQAGERARASSVRGSIPASGQNRQGVAGSSR